MPTLPCRKRPPSHTNGAIPSKITTKRTPHSYGLSRLSATGGVFFYSASEKFFPRSAPSPIKAALQSPLNPLFTTSPPAAAARPSSRFLRVLRFPHCFCGLSHFWFLQDSTAWPASNGASAAFEIFAPNSQNGTGVLSKRNRSVLVYPLAPGVGREIWT